MLTEFVKKNVVFLWADRPDLIYIQKDFCLDVTSVVLYLLFLSFIVSIQTISAEN